MRVGVGMRSAGDQAGKKIAVGKPGFVTEPDDDQLQRGDNIKPLLAAADGGGRYQAGMRGPPGYICSPSMAGS